MSMRWRLAVSLEGLELLGDELVLRVLRHELERLPARVGGLIHILRHVRGRLLELALVPFL